MSIKHIENTTYYINIGSKRYRINERIDEIVPVTIDLTLDDNETESRPVKKPQKQRIQRRKASELSIKIQDTEPKWSTNNRPDDPSDTTALDSRIQLYSDEHETGILTIRV